MIQVLNIPNENNKLLCDAFLQIHFAPREMIRESAMYRSYSISVNGEEVMFDLVDMARVLFKNVSSACTLAATGMEAKDWRDAWKKKYPITTDDTVMAVYMYKRSTIDIDRNETEDLANSKG